MSVIVPVGMHGSGSSLVASILDALGVNMHYNPKAKVKWYQNYEDSNFIRLNVQILKECGGNWRNPPAYKRILILRDSGKFDARIKKLIVGRKGLWGFKDPRACVTIPVIHPFLDAPKYIKIVRSYKAIAESLMSRGGKSKKERWIKLSKHYYNSLDLFLKSVDSPRIVIMFDDLLNPKKSKQVVIRIAKFVGSKKIGVAMKRIDYKRGK